MTQVSFSQTSVTSFKDESDYWDKEDFDYDEYEDDYENELNVRETVNIMNQTTKQSLGHRLESMLLGCTYAGKICSIK